VSDARPTVLLVFDEQVYRSCTAQAETMERLGRLAAWEWLPSQGGERYGPNEDPRAIDALVERIAPADGLIVCHGAPKISASLLDRAPRLRLVGELEGDRFAYRIDLEAAWARGVRTVDTTHGSSYPVAEWALALILISLKNAGQHFRQMIQHQAYTCPRDDFAWSQGRLWGRRVGLIGCGHIGRRLVRFLQPFQCDVRVHDPYLPKEVADVLGLRLTSLDLVLAESEVVVCLAPLTPGTRRLIGRRELDLLRPGSVLVNVSRGAIVDPDALVDRLRRGDIVAGLDVFDPEPIPATHPIKDLPNVFLTPHIAAVGRGGPTFLSLMVDELERFFGGHETLYDLTPQTRANRQGQPPVR
jgi:phosphoglycerate dehydrogenase-like enzyme